MAERFDTVEDVLRERQPQLPVYCIFPHVYRETAKHFVSGFPGRVLYALKANNNPLVISSLHEAGVEHFDCASLQEIMLARQLCPNASCYFMNPVRFEGDAGTAQDDYAVRHFKVDHLSGIAPLLREIDAASSVVFARMAVSHDSAVGDLSTKFGAPPEKIPELLTAIRDSGAEAALAFNVGTGVMHPEAYIHSLQRARDALQQISFRVRLVDVGGGFPRTYPGFPARPLDEYFAAIQGLRHELPLTDNAELMAEPGRALSAPGMSTLTKVLLRKDDCLFLNDGMYGAFWELRFKGHLEYPARCFRGHEPLPGETLSFRLFGPTCDSSDEMPARVDLPADIDVGDYIEFGTMGAYSLSGRTDFNGFFSEDIVEITAQSSRPPK
ncbi:MAG: type III PLP-dependent enzyme [Woeseiaceae bacterium]